MSKSKINIWPMYTVFGVVLIIFSGLVGFVYFTNQKNVEPAEKKVLAANTEVKASEEKEITSESNWQAIFPEVKPMSISGVEVQASVADNWPDRIKGLSETPYLPEHVVKLFVFDSLGFHSIWMKDMNYSIDIIWVDDASKIVHLEEEAAPESYPAAFVPKVQAKYVIETSAGFIKNNKVNLGDVVVLPTL